MTGQRGRFSAGAWRCAQCQGQRGLAQHEGDSAHGHDPLQWADAMDPGRWVGSREADGRPSAERCSAGFHKHDIVRHHAEQANRFAGMEGIDACRVPLTDGSSSKPWSRERPEGDGDYWQVPPQDMFVMASGLGQ